MRNRKNFKKNLLIILALTGLGFFGYETYKKSNKDDYYIERFKLVKSRMIYGSTIDTEQELNDYHDQTEVSMYQDGYTGPEIMEIRTKAFKEALSEGKQ